MTPELPSGLRERILADARREPSRTRAERQWRVVLAAVLGAATSLSISARLGLPDDRAPKILLGLAVAGGLLALAATWVAGSRGRSMLGRSRAALVTVAALVPLGLFVFGVLAAGFEGPLEIVGSTAAQHAVCFAVTLLFALGPFAAVAYARRGTDPVHPRALGAALGAAAGAWGGTLIDVHCTRTSVEHLAVGHIAPIVVLAAVGALVGARLFGVRARAD